jgi:hypothetical protein
VFLVAPACAAPAAAVRDRAPDPRLERVAWLPGDTRDLAYFRADQSPLLRTAKQIPLPIPKGSPSLETAVLVFASPLQAAQAVQAAEREIAAPRWSDGARQALQRLAPKAIGSDVHVSLAALLAGTSPEALAELTQAMKQYTEAMRAGQQPAPGPLKTVPPAALDH